ncbi:MAG: DUF4965 domain-containing protein [Phycisphaerales bacterium]
MKSVPAIFAVILSLHAAAAQQPARSVPAVPLITFDPYISVWSMRDKLTDDWPRHWSGSVMGMSGLVWVDGKCYRWCGPMPQGVPAASQESVQVGLTSTHYTFKAGGVTLAVDFASHVWLGGNNPGSFPTVADVNFLAKSDDGKEHQVHVYIDVTGEWCTSDSNDAVTWSRHKISGADVLSMSKVDQPVLEHAGDQRKIDWGRLYLVGGSQTVVAGHNAARATFAKSGQLPESDDLRSPRPASDDWPVLAAAVDLGKLAANGTETHILIGYDEGESIELFGRHLKPLWAAKAETGLAESFRIAGAGTAGKATEFQPGRKELTAGGDFVLNTTMRFGDRYAGLLTLAYRQVVAGHGIAADWDGTPLMFAKENSSNGCISTVDVIYPACPFFLYHCPELLRAQLRPLMQYSASPRWKFPFAPHDLGQYPKANGQVYGGGERTEDDQMPVEETGNMLIMLAALAKVEPKEGVAFCEPYWPMLEKWAGYLKQHGLDPANQLCTDDFAGHLARNSNLSAKTVVALAAYAQLLGAAGKQAESQQWRTTAEDFAKRWTELNKADAPNNPATPLVFGEKGKDTWSQKYNLIWDRALGLKLFPQDFYEHEMAFYRTKMNKYGLPLDSRRAYTKLDWTSWTACLTGKRDDFDAIMAPTLDWANASPPPSRVALSDWYDTNNGRYEGFTARTVVGGLWMPLLIDKLNIGK